MKSLFGRKHDSQPASSSYKPASKDSYKFWVPPSRISTESSRQRPSQSADSELPNNVIAPSGRAARSSAAVPAVAFSSSDGPATHATVPPQQRAHYDTHGYSSRPLEPNENGKSNSTREKRPAGGSSVVAPDFWQSQPQPIASSSRRHRDRDEPRERDRERDRHRTEDSERRREKERDKERDRRDRDADREIDRQRERDAARRREKEASRDRDKGETSRSGDRERERSRYHSDREKDRGRRSESKVDHGRHRESDNEPSDRRREREYDRKTSVPPISKSTTREANDSGGDSSDSSRRKPYTSSGHRRHRTEDGPSSSRAPTQHRRTSSHPHPASPVVIDAGPSNLPVHLPGKYLPSNEDPPSGLSGSDTERVKRRDRSERYRSSDRDRHREVVSVQLPPMNSASAAVTRQQPNSHQYLPPKATDSAAYHTSDKPNDQSSRPGVDNVQRPTDNTYSGYSQPLESRPSRPSAEHGYSQPVETRPSRPVGTETYHSSRTREAYSSSTRPHAGDGYYSSSRARENHVSRPTGDAYHISSRYNEVNPLRSTTADISHRPIEPVSSRGGLDAAYHKHPSTDTTAIRSLGGEAYHNTHKAQDITPIRPLGETSSYRPAEHPTSRPTVRDLPATGYNAVSAAPDNAPNVHKPTELNSSRPPTADSTHRIVDNLPTHPSPAPNTRVQSESIKPTESPSSRRIPTTHPAMANSAENIPTQQITEDPPLPAGTPGATHFTSGVSPTTGHDTGPHSRPSENVPRAPAMLPTISMSSHQTSLGAPRSGSHDVPSSNPTYNDSTSIPPPTQNTLKSQPEIKPSLDSLPRIITPMLSIPQPMVTLTHPTPQISSIGLVSLPENDAVVPKQTRSHLAVPGAKKKRKSSKQRDSPGTKDKKLPSSAKAEPEQRPQTAPIGPDNKTSKEQDTTRRTSHRTPSVLPLPVATSITGQNVTTTASGDTETSRPLGPPTTSNQISASMVANTQPSSDQRPSDRLTASYETTRQVDTSHTSAQVIGTMGSAYHQDSNDAAPPGSKQDSPPRHTRVDTSRTVPMQAPTGMPAAHLPVAQRALDGSRGWGVQQGGNDYTRHLHDQTGVQPPSVPVTHVVAHPSSASRLDSSRVTPPQRPESRTGKADIPSKPDHDHTMAGTHVIPTSMMSRTEQPPSIHATPSHRPETRTTKASHVSKHTGSHTTQPTDNHPSASIAWPAVTPIPSELPARDSPPKQSPSHQSLHHVSSNALPATNAVEPPASVPTIDSVPSWGIVDVGKSKYGKDSQWSTRNANGYSSTSNSRPLLGESASRIETKPQSHDIVSRGAHHASGFQPNTTYLNSASNSAYKSAASASQKPMHSSSRDTHRDLGSSSRYGRDDVPFRQAKEVPPSSKVAAFQHPKLAELLSSPSQTAPTGSGGRQAQHSQAVLSSAGVAQGTERLSSDSHRSKPPSPATRTLNSKESPSNRHWPTPPSPNHALNSTPRHSPASISKPHDPRINQDSIMHHSTSKEYMASHKPSPLMNPTQSVQRGVQSSADAYATTNDAYRTVDNQSLARPPGASWTSSGKVVNSASQAAASHQRSKTSLTQPAQPSSRPQDDALYKRNSALQNLGVQNAATYTPSNEISQTRSDSRHTSRTTLPDRAIEAATLPQVDQQPKQSARNPSELSRARPPSEDSLLKTPSSLAASILKPTISRTSIPTSVSSTHNSHKTGLFKIFRPRTQTENQEVRFDSSSEKPDGGKDKESSRTKGKPTPINVPTDRPGIPDRKSPTSKVFTPFRYLTSRRYRTVSAASAEAINGTAPNTVVGSPTASMHSQNPLQPPPLRDPVIAADAWRHEMLQLPSKKVQRPGVVFDVAEEPAEDKQRSFRSAFTSSKPKRVIRS